MRMGPDDQSHLQRDKSFQYFLWEDIHIMNDNINSQKKSFEPVTTPTYKYYYYTQVYTEARLKSLVNCRKVVSGYTFPNSNIS